MYNNYYRELDEPDNFEEIYDEDEMTEFIPPYDCPFYRQFQMPGGGFTPPRPPFGPPGQGGPGEPGVPRPGQIPSGPPPSFIPSQAQSHQYSAGIGTQAVDPRPLRRCRFRYVYIWLRNGSSFWAWLTFVGRNSCAGYRWNGRRWVYFGIDLRRIASFICY